MLKLGNLCESWKLSYVTETPAYRNCKAVCVSMLTIPVLVSLLRIARCPDQVLRPGLSSLSQWKC